MRLGLALSGGGTRALVFHLGVLHRLAEEHWLERVSILSTVSGGSIAAALLFSHAGMHWPDSRGFIELLYPRLRTLLTSRDVLSLRSLRLADLVRYHHHLATARARVLAGQLQRRWGVAGRLSELPEAPLWYINTTCLETGKNWRFARREMGDWQFGRHYAPPFTIAEAAAASAAVPYAIGALPFDLPADGWYRTDPATRAPLQRQAPPVQRVRLWDGGAYENLGLETIFKPAKPLIGCDFLICSDASGTLGPVRNPLTVLLKGDLGSPRLFDIASDQIRSLRARMFVGALGEGKVRGALLRMGLSVRDVDLRVRRERPGADYDQFQTDEETALALRHPTNLKALPLADFDRIARHGYEVADATLTGHAADLFAKSVSWRPGPRQLADAANERGWALEASDGAL